MVYHCLHAAPLLYRTGDQILEYNGTELREATAEEAAFELAKPLDKVSILVQYNIQRKFISLKLVFFATKLFLT